MRKILLVEDESRIHAELNRLFNNKNLLEELFGETEFTIFLESDWEGVLDFLRTEGKPYACIFDIQLNLPPLELNHQKIPQDGISLASKLLKKYKNKLPIIFLTNYFDNTEYLTRIMDLHISPQFFVAKYATQNPEQPTLKNPKHFLTLLKAAIEEQAEADYLLFANRKIGIAAKLNGNQPITYAFYSKNEILLVKGVGGICEIYTSDGIKHLLATTGRHAIRQLEIYNCFETFGVADSIAVNVERIHQLKFESFYFIVFDNERRTSVELNRKELEQIKLKLKTLGLVMGTEQ